MAAVGRIPIRVLGQVATAIVEALIYLSDKLRMVHRDVRPARMFLNSRGEVKLGGFQVSTSLDRQSASSPMSYGGLMMYYSPERVTNSVASTKGDVWSLGISLFELAVARTRRIEKCLVKDGTEGAKRRASLHHLYVRGIPSLL